MNRYKDGWMNRYKDGRMNRYKEGWMYMNQYKAKDEWMDEPIYGWMDEMYNKVSCITPILWTALFPSLVYSTTKGI